MWVWFGKLVFQLVLAHNTHTHKYICKTVNFIFIQSLKFAFEFVLYLITNLIYICKMIFLHAQFDEFWHVFKCRVRQRMFLYHRNFLFSFSQLNIIPSPSNDNCYSYFNHHILVWPLFALRNVEFCCYR